MNILDKFGIDSCNEIVFVNKDTGKIDYGFEYNNSIEKTESKKYITECIGCGKWLTNEEVQESELKIEFDFDFNDEVFHGERIVCLKCSSELKSKNTTEMIEHINENWDVKIEQL